MVQSTIQSTRTTAESIATSNNAYQSCTSHSPIYINVYDLPNMQRSNSCMGKLGVGAYHTAIQVGK